MRKINTWTAIVAILSSVLFMLTNSQAAQANLPNLTQISTGFLHSCALNTAGEVFCWGSNEVGQLGIGKVSTTEPGPEKLTGFSKVRMITAGGAHNCLIDEKRDLYCWGQNEVGKIGSGNLDQANSPTRVKGISDVDFVHASRLATCAVSKGEVYCWGSNQLGELVTESTEKQILLPSIVPGLKNISKVLVGTQFSCALNREGQVYCWGIQLNGRLGNVENEKISGPVRIQLPTSAVDIGVGAGHACAVLSNAELFCWGWGERGQLGNGVLEPTVSSPSKVENLPPTKTIVLNRFGSCAIDISNKVHCWGGGEFGQNGNSEKKDLASPSLVEGLSEVRSLSSASSYTSHMCAIESNRTAKCWGYGLALQLGNSVQGDLAKPVKIFQTASNSSSSSSNTAEKESLTDITIQCKKGSQVRIVSGVSPKCPSGFQEVRTKKLKSVFYLDLKKGCYAANSSVSARIATRGREDYKTLYKSTCKTPYHFQVIFSGKVSTSSGSSSLTQEDMQRHCSVEYEKALKRKYPTSIIGGEIYLSWFFPDVGLEASRYPQKGICYLWKWDSKRVYGDAPYAEVVSSPLAKG